jgi:hypothetical protein
MPDEFTVAVQKYQTCLNALAKTARNLHVAVAEIEQAADRLKGWAEAIKANPGKALGQELVLRQRSGPNWVNAGDLATLWQAWESARLAAETAWSNIPGDRLGVVTPQSFAM